MSNYTGLNTRLKVVSKPVASIDDNYGPYDNVEDALNSIPLALRAVGLTVGIIEGDTVVEYWFQKDVQDNNLIRKTLPSTLNKETIADIRNLSTSEINLLKNGTYRGVTLHGYHEKGDTPSPIDYYLSDTVEEDNGVSIIEVGDIKLVHNFVGEVDLRYFGIVSSSTIPQTTEDG
jgi:hypothetical protein